MTFKQGILELVTYPVTTDLLDCVRRLDLRGEIRKLDNLQNKVDIEQSKWEFDRLVKLKWRTA